MCKMYYSLINNRLQSIGSRCYKLERNLKIKNYYIAYIINMLSKNL